MVAPHASCWAMYGQALQGSREAEVAKYRGEPPCSVLGPARTNFVAQTPQWAPKKGDPSGNHPGRHSRNNQALVHSFIFPAEGTWVGLARSAPTQA